LNTHESHATVMYRKYTTLTPLISNHHPYPKTLWQGSFLSVLKVMVLFHT